MQSMTVRASLSGDQPAGRVSGGWMSLILLLLGCHVLDPEFVPDTPNCEARTAFYADADGDGAGDPLVVYIGCEAPTGYVADGTDCDDADATVQAGCNDTSVAAAGG